MGRRRYRKQKEKIYENVKITDLAIEGRGVGKVPLPESDELLTLFVEKTVPGDVVDVKITGRKSNYKEGFPVLFHSYSPKRIDPFCKHFGLCGGCTRQNLTYADQLFYKQQQVEQTLKRLAKVQIPEIQPIMPAPTTKFYRNKLEFSFTNRRWLTADEIGDDTEISQVKGLGFHIPGRFDKVLDIEECSLQQTPSNAIRLFVKAYGIKHGYDFFNLYKAEGFLRNLIIRTSSSGELMLIVSFFENKVLEIQKLLDALKKEFPEITSLNYVINHTKNDSIADLPVVHYAGLPYLNEKMGDIQFKVGPKSFYQTNSEQAHNLYLQVKEIAELTPEDIVYDLYTGTGTIANFIARDVKQVVGIEYVKEAVEDAKVNSQINGIENTRFFAGDMKDILTEDFIRQNGTPNLIIADPPRAGMHKSVIQTLLNTQAEKIIYVSCNVATQARDIQILSEKYILRKIQPVDMFPHTHHIENIVLLQKKESTKPIHSDGI
ncbi:MAG: 23S rRNA (uracil(1939)-C(5))-methyltransferase RlmD [Bacteroidia bacterium]|nr:MAG: 23S rRNA (uracil(1939)-C(5))-methyltransferase RlmD [Bacteroidia bacterium]